MIVDANTLVSLEEDDLDDMFIVIDHRSAEEEVVDAISDQLDEPLTHFYSGDQLWVKLNGNDCQLPLTNTRHDRYVVVSSLAELLKSTYTFWLSKDNLEDDTHYLMIFKKMVSGELASLHSGFIEDKFVPLELGYDYFNGIKVPYFGHEDNNPEFDWEAKTIDEGLYMLRPDLVKQKLAELKDGNPSLRMRVGRLTILISMVIILAGVAYQYLI